MCEVTDEVSKHPPWSIHTSTITLPGRIFLTISSVFRKYDVIHYCVPNIPSGFARTASQAISNVLMPLLLQMADDGGFENLVWYKINIRSGIYLFKGALTNFQLSERFDLKFTDLNLLIASSR